MSGPDLAPELWVEILRLSFTHVDILGSASRRAPWNLMAVSKAWRDLILSTPDLWIRIHFFFRDYMDSWLRGQSRDKYEEGLSGRIATCLKSSEPHLLIVTSYGESHAAKSLSGGPEIHLFMHDLHRIEHFGNLGSRFNLTEIGQLTSTPRLSMPNLRTLEHNNDSDSENEVTVLLKRLRAPNITNISLTSEWLDADTLAPLNLGILHSLSIQRCTVKFSNFLAILRQLTQLEVLEVEDVRHWVDVELPSSEGPTAMFCHRTLKSLTVVESNAVEGPVSFIFNSFQFPSLTHLSITFSPYGPGEVATLLSRFPPLCVDDIAAFIRRSDLNETLARLELRPPPDKRRSFDVRSILVEARGVQDLTISLNTIRDVARLGLGGKGPQLAPQLTSLTVAHAAGGDAAAKAFLEVLESRVPVLREVRVLSLPFSLGPMYMERLRDLGERLRFEVIIPR